MRAEGSRLSWYLMQLKFIYIFIYSIYMATHLKQVGGKQS